MEELQKYWTSGISSEKEVDSSGLSGENGTILLAADAQCIPYDYVIDGQIVGYEVDIITRFCREYGYTLEIENVLYSSMLQGVASGKYDIGCGNAMIFEGKDKNEEIYFSHPIFNGGNYLVVRNLNSQKSGIFIQLYRSFKRNFIDEQRYLLVLKGMGTTFFITLLSAFFGTVWGMLLYLICFHGNKIALKIINGYLWVIKGMPVVVLLMILYYVIFGATKISGIWISIIGFTLVTGANVYGMMKTGVSAIDVGQMEAALALGYTKQQAFFRMIFPQAAKIVLPNYETYLIELIKATAVVGYIAVEDLTRIGDVIRSRTYEALFPLIITAVLYFVMGYLLTVLARIISVKIDTKRRSKKEILKGIDVEAPEG